MARGRPRKFKTVEELQAAIDAAFARMEEEGHIPTMRRLEAYVGIDLNREAGRSKAFCAVVQRARERVIMEGESAALDGRMAPAVSKIYLSTHGGYSVKTEVSVSGSVNLGKSLESWTKLMLAKGATTDEVIGRLKEKALGG